MTSKHYSLINLFSLHPTAHDLLFFCHKFFETLLEKDKMLGQVLMSVYRVNPLPQNKF